MRIQINFIKNDSLLFKLAVSIFILTFFILFIFEPFGDIKHGYFLSGIIRVLTYAFTASISFYLSERYIKYIFKRLLPKSIYTPVFWYFIELFIITIAIFACKTLWVGFNNTSLASFFIVLYRVLVIGVIPFAFIVVLLYSFNKSSVKSKEIAFKSKDKNPEYLKLPQKQILYLKSDENYTTIYFKNKEGLQSKILRGSLSYFEATLSLPFFRIHRGIIVNINAIKNVDINSQGGTIILNVKNIELRISRTYVTDFKKYWNTLHYT
ncbi:hypothetical protein GTQ40_04340 [Flavobacteriaceae bacterium R38]|nr:hypothetical protein [Flavobacteriaceae bacterium R38]